MRKHVQISRFEPRKTSDGLSWQLVSRLVTIPMAALQHRFGWQTDTPVYPSADANDSNARVLSMRLPE